MKYSGSYHPERFDLRDSDWEFLSVQDGELVARVDDVNILSGEDSGEIIESAIVTFHGFRLTWFHLFRGENEEVPLPLDQAVKLMADGPYFVFSYCCDDHECELATVSSGESFTMLFTFDSVDIAWDGFKRRPMGYLIRK